MKRLTITMEDSFYEMIRLVADEKKQEINNLFKEAILNYISNNYVSDEEMQEILDDKELVKSLERGIEEAKNGDYIIV